MESPDGTILQSDTCPWKSNKKRESKDGKEFKESRKREAKVEENITEEEKDEVKIDRETQISQHRNIQLAIHLILPKKMRY